MTKLTKCDFCDRSRYHLFWKRFIQPYNIIIKGNHNYINNEKLISHLGTDYNICGECIHKKFKFNLAFIKI